ncbi:hypothetical protein QOT17_023683 [Balamuthia mandrillaris]
MRRAVVSFQERTHTPTGFLRNVAHTTSRPVFASPSCFRTYSSISSGETAEERQRKWQAVDDVKAKLQKEWGQRVDQPEKYAPSDIAFGVGGSEAKPQASSEKYGVGGSEAQAKIDRKEPGQEAVLRQKSPNLAGEGEKGAEKERYKIRPEPSENMLKPPGANPSDVGKRDRQGNM